MIENILIKNSAFCHMVSHLFYICEKAHTNILFTDISRRSYQDEEEEKVG